MLKAWINLKLLWLVALLGAGCARPAGVIFEALADALVWPDSPEPTRISYVGQIATSADLKPAVSFGEAIGQAIFGKKPDRSMLTPYAICTDGKDRLFVADSNAQCVHVFNLNTRKYDQWKPPAGILLSQPVGIAWNPQGHLYVADSVGGRICIFDTNGTMTGLYGSTYVTRPCGMVFDAKNQRLIVADAARHEIVILSTQDQSVLRIGHRGGGPGQFNYPTNVALDSTGRLYVSDSLNFRVQQFSPDFQTVRQIGRQGDLPGYFAQPKGMAVDSQDHLYVVDAQFESVQIFDADGNVLLDFGQEGSNPGEFWLPAGIFIDSRDRIWVADSYNRRVQVFDYHPEVATP